MATYRFVFQIIGRKYLLQIFTFLGMLLVVYLLLDFLKQDHIFLLFQKLFYFQCELFYLYLIFLEGSCYPKILHVSIEPFSFLINKKILILIINTTQPWNIVFCSLELFSILFNHIHSVNQHQLLIYISSLFSFNLMFFPESLSLYGFRAFPILRIFYHHQMPIFKIKGFFSFVLINLQILPKSASTTVKR